ncbi:hypothetical protein ILUMI_21597 [Ignelater luminosus]|uniref:Uncharacterized protein n=1 Tax=Ignelater luminosus TaxID=2038154 RepID=A0A8K0CC48_IGNLU|nr:hypothetical protein ILUMI_21597 [Ignelater luminosus]
MDELGFSTVGKKCQEIAIKGSKAVGSVASEERGINITIAFEKRLRSNVDRAITQYQVAELPNEAYGRAATIETAIN